jgi:hypothetical protein
VQNSHRWCEFWWRQDCSFKEGARKLTFKFPFPPLLALTQAISVVLAAVTARVRAASINANTTSKSDSVTTGGDDGTVRLRGFLLFGALLIQPSIAT